MAIDPLACQEKNPMRRVLAVSMVMLQLTACQGMQAEPPTPGDNSPAPQVIPAPSPPAAAGDAARGALRSSELYCDACHGVNGVSETAEWPSLAGQIAAYLAEQLKLLRSGARSSPEMEPMAVPLSDADIADLAAHYSAQALTARPVSSDEAKAGESLYREGDRARGMGACSMCHGADGWGNLATGAPVVRSQQPGYTVRQLEAYANRTRYSAGAPIEHGGGDLEIMYTIAEKLTPEEIRSLAAYLYGMP